AYRLSLNALVAPFGAYKPDVHGSFLVLGTRDRVFTLHGITTILDHPALGLLPGGPEIHRSANLFRTVRPPGWRCSLASALFRRGQVDEGPLGLLARCRDRDGISALVPRRCHLRKIHSRFLSRSKPPLVSRQHSSHVRGSVSRKRPEPR